MFNLTSDSLSARLRPLQKAITGSDLPPKVIEFGPWLPDRGILANPGCLEAKNVIPQIDHYGPVGGLSAVSTALTARGRGGLAVRGSDGVVSIFAADISKLYKLVAGTFNDVSKSGGYTTAEDFYTEFILWGNKVIAINYTDAVQIYNLASSSLFADMITSTLKPKARHIAVVGDFVMLGGTNDAVDGEVPNRVWWSKINDETNFDPAESTLCDFNDFPSGGWVQKIVGLSRFCLVFFDTEIWRGQFVGSPRIFRFDIIEKNRGTSIPNSVVSNGIITCFINEEGFFATDGNSSVPIGAGQIDQWFSDTYDPNYAHRVSSSYDPLNKLFAWSFPSVDATGGTPDKILFWSPIYKKWTHVDVAHESLVISLTQGYTLDQLDSVGTDIDNATVFPVSFDSRLWMGGLLRFGAFDTSHKLAQFTGTTLEATIDTSVFQPNGMGLTDVTGIFPLVSGSTNVTQKLAAATRLGDSLTYGSAVAINSFGKANFASNGRYFKTETIVAAGETGWKAQGIQLEATATGEP